MTSTDDDDAATALPAHVIEEQEKLDQEAEDEYKEEKRNWKSSNADFLSQSAELKNKRLQHILDKAGLYSEWLGAKLKSRQEELIKEEEEKTAQRDKPTEKNDDNGAENYNDISKETQPEPLVAPRRSSRSATVHSSLASTANQIQENSMKKATTSSRKRKSTGSVETGSSKKPSRRKTIGSETDLQKFQEILDEHLVAKTGRQPAFVTGCTMRDYQLVGLEWLVSLYDHGLNGILADEMGLGKTLQTIAFLAYLREKGVPSPFLIVGPLSTLSNWVNEFHKFCPAIPVMLYHGNPDERIILRNKLSSYSKWTFPIVITSYEIIMKDQKYLSSYQWKYIIVDEGHRLKNLSCRLIRDLKSYTSANRLLLTGTPLQNNISELWSLLNFLMPDIFDDLEVFADWFDFSEDLKKSTSRGKSKIVNRENETNIISNLHSILKPFLLRRVKSEVEIAIPPKKEYIIYCPVMPKQRKLYDAAKSGPGGLRKYLIEKKSGALVENGKASLDTNTTNVSDSIVDDFENEENVQDQENVPTNGARRKSSRQRGTLNYEIDIGDDEYFDMIEANATKEEALAKVKQSNVVSKPVGTGSLQNVIMQLRKVCNHPYLFDLCEEEEEEVNDQSAKDQAEEQEDEDSISSMHDIVKSSGKMLMLEALLRQLFARGHKVLIFSQMTKMLDIIHDYCDMKQWNVCRIDGAIHIVERQEQIKSFSDPDGDIKLFLLSTRAGGLGINLTAADTVILFDSDWNPQMDLQAQDRVHRIGQTKPVAVFRLVSRNTVEAGILEKAGEKRKLERLVIHNEQFKGTDTYYNSKKVIDVKDLAGLLEDSEGISNNDGDKQIHSLKDVISDEDMGRLMKRDFDETNNSVETVK